MLLAKITKAQNLFAAAVPVKAAILKFMEKYPVHPPNGTIRAGHFVPKAPLLLGGTAAATDDRGHVKFSKQKLVNLVDRVGFLRCIDETSPGEKGALTFEVKYADELTTAPSRVGFAPAWWLPWNGAGALVKLTIEPSTTPNLNFGIGIANQQQKAQAAPDGHPTDDSPQLVGRLQVRRHRDAMPLPFAQLEPGRQGRAKFRRADHERIDGRIGRRADQEQQQ